MRKKLLRKSKRAKIVFDTSSYVAALLSKSGGAAKIFEQIIQQDLFNFYTAEILVEIKKVLAKPKFELEQEKQAHFLHLIQEVSFKVSQLKEFLVKECRDPSDDKFLSLANQIGAEFIISLDKDLLALRQIGRTRIVTPGEFINRETKQSL